MASSISSADFDAVCSTDQDGENCTVYTPTITEDSDYGNAASYTLGSGTTEVMIVDEAPHGDVRGEEGSVRTGDVFLMAKSDSIISEDKLVKVNRSGKLYEIYNVEALAPGGAVHHFEVYGRYLRTI